MSKTEETLKQAVIASKQWKVMRQMVSKVKLATDEATTTRKWFNQIYDNLDSETLASLQGILDGWASAKTAARVTSCNIIMTLITNVRPEESIRDQASSEFNFGKLDENASVSSMIMFSKVVSIMKHKLNSSAKESYKEEDHLTWELQIDSLCVLIESGMPQAMGIVSDKKKVGNIEPRNKNSKLASYLQHLKIKNVDLYNKYTGKLEASIKRRRNSCSDAEKRVSERILKEYEAGMIFDQKKVTEEVNSSNSDGVYTGMANIDWLLLAAFHLKSAGYDLTTAKKILKGVAQYSMLCPITQAKSAELTEGWTPYKPISARMEKGDGKDMYMCPLALTPGRLVNCAATMFEAASDVYVLRGTFTVMAMAEYVALQVLAHGGIVSLPTASGTTSNIEWLTYRLLLTGACCSPSMYITNQRNPLSGGVMVKADEDDE